MQQGRRHTTVTFGGRPKSLNTSYIQPVCQLFEESDKKKVFTTDKSQVSFSQGNVKIPLDKKSKEIINQTYLNLLSWKTVEN